MNITVGQSSDVGHCLSRLNLFPEGVSEDIILAKNCHDLVILNNLQRPGDNEAEVVNALPSVIQEVTGSAETTGRVNKQINTRLMLS